MSTTLPGAHDAPDTSKQSKVKRKRITTEARNLLLKTFYTTSITRPTQQQKEELVQQVLALPNCEHFCMKFLETWFTYQRKKQNKNRNKPGTVSFQSDSLPFKEKTATTLETLHRGTPQPSLEITTHFTHTKYKTHPEDGHRRQMDESSLSTPVISQSSLTATFPTQTPPPSLNTNDVWSWNAAQTLRATPMLLNPYLLHPSIALGSVNTNHSGPKERMFVPTPTPVPEPLPDPVRTELLLAIHEDLNSFKSPPRPKTREGLAAELGPYQKMMENFLVQVNDGLFAKWGFQPEGVVGS